jgi:hypothetical protein
MRYQYALQELQPCPPAIVRQIRGQQLTKNMTNLLGMRWKEIALSDSLEDLSAHLCQGRRVVDWNTLEVVSTDTSK